jgi:3-oxoadipate CoA-transferase, beta subunit
LTGVRCVRRVYTDLAVIEIAPSGLLVHEMCEGIGEAELRSRTGAQLSFARNCRLLTAPSLADGD